MTLNSAESMISLEVRTLVTFGYFKQYNIMILDALQFLTPETMSTRDKLRIANINLSESLVYIIWKSICGDLNFKCANLLKSEFVYYIQYFQLLCNSTDTQR